MSFTTRRYASTDGAAIQPSARRASDQEIIHRYVKAYTRKSGPLENLKGFLFAVALCQYIPPPYSYLKEAKITLADYFVHLENSRILTYL